MKKDLQSDDRLELEKFIKKSNELLKSFQLKLEGLAHCFFCNKSKKLLIHHIDGNPYNNTRKNLMILCYSCHLKLHAKFFRIFNIKIINRERV